MSVLRENIQVSFCTTCMGRLEHLKHTLPLNLIHNQQTPLVEFVLLDYSSPDELQNWVKDELKTELSTGRVVFYSAAGFQHFHHAHAKNVAHRLARGEIVCNLDADNFTGFGFAEYLMDAFSTGERIMIRSPRFIHGTFGRIALRKIDFEAIGGYNERMKFGWGYEDDDFIKRAAMAGIKEYLIPAESSFLTAITHKNLDRTKFNKIQQHRKSRKQHKLISSKQLARNEFIANQRKRWGTTIVTKNFSENIVM